MQTEVSNEVSRDVQAMYTRYPFPSKDRIENELPGYLPGFVKRLLNRRTTKETGIAMVADLTLRQLEKPWHVLDAGCGTGEVLCTLVQRIHDADFQGIDLTPVSLEKARRLLEREGISGVNLQQHDLMESLPFEPGQFNLIYSIGVIHCLDDPVQGLKNLKRCLAPGGRILIYVYGLLGRRELMYNQEIVSLLAQDDHDFEDKIRIVESLDIYPHNRVKDVILRSIGFNRETTKRSWIVDQFAHVNEKVYTIAEIQRDLQAAGLSLSRVHARERLEHFIKDPELLRRAEAFSPDKRYRLWELLARPKGYLFTAEHTSDVSV